MSNAMPEPYRHLAAFLHAWFHQDFDLAGNTVEEIVTVYKLSATRADMEAIIAEIAAFLASPLPNRAVQFEQLFDLDIDPLGFAPSVEEFLGAITRILSSNEEPEL